jgi:hypothetical protein
MATTTETDASLKIYNFKENIEFQTSEAAFGQRSV